METGTKNAIENTIGMMKVSGLGALAAENPSGTAPTLGKIGHVTALLTHPGIVLPETLATGAYLKGSQAARALGKLGETKIPGTPKMPISPQGLNKAALGAYLARTQPNLSFELQQELKRRAERR